MKTWLTETLHWCLVNKLSVTLRLLIFIFFLFIVIYYFVFCFPYKLKLIQDPISLWSKLQSCQPDLDEAVSESAAGLTGRRPHRPDRQERAQHQHWHERPRPAHPVLHTHTAISVQNTHTHTHQPRSTHLTATNALQTSLRQSVTTTITVLHHYWIRLLTNSFMKKFLPKLEIFIFNLNIPDIYYKCKQVKGTVFHRMWECTNVNCF